jgi:hypothetical protein
VSAVTQIVLVYEDGTTITVPVEQYEEPPMDPVVETAPKRKTKRKAPRRRCQTCERLVAKEDWESHRESHEPQAMQASVADSEPSPMDARIERDETEALEEPPQEGEMPF